MAFYHSFVDSFRRRRPLYASGASFHRQARLFALSLVAAGALCAMSAGAQAGFLDDLFGAAAPQPQQQLNPQRGRRAAPGYAAPRYDSDGGFYSVAPMERKKRHASIGSGESLTGSVSAGPRDGKNARRAVGALKRAAAGATGEISDAGRFVCVRMCDGAVVSLARRANAAQAPSCDNACPGAEARLFTLQPGSEDISAATDSVEKIRYADLVARLKSADGEKKACACGSVAARADIGVDDFFADATLRNGDVVATTEGLRVFHGPGRLPHRTADFLAFAETRGRMARATHGALVAIDQNLRTANGGETTPAFK